MTSTEPNATEALARDYAAALEEYLSGAGEAALTRAYELGRKASANGLGVLDLALLHHEALQRLPRPALGIAAQFLAEALSPFEMTLRSYQANARLLGLSENLAQQNAEIDRAREQLRTILDATTAVIYLKDADGRYLFVNRQFQEVFGLARDQVIGKLDGDVLPPPIARTLQTDDAQVLLARAPRQLEETIPALEGGPHTYISSKFPLLDAAGVPYGVCCVATDITDQKRAAEALERAREAAARERQLAEAVDARDKFLAIASHELKTPLTSLELQVASLRRLTRSNPDARVADDAVQTRCDVMLRQVERLTVLINNLIDVGRISSGQMGLSRERVDLGELVRAVVTQFQEVIRRSGSEVTVRDPAAVVGSWDRLRLETVVANLVSNAVKFGSGNPITISVGADDDHAVLSIRDRGIGVSAEDQQRIFDRFERAVSERHFGGFGIGLWVARQAVEAHGGTIHVRSEPGEGSEFWIALPFEGDSPGA
jgi:PAS domain S-box-containing protein